MYTTFLHPWKAASPYLNIFRYLHSPLYIANLWPQLAIIITWLRCGSKRTFLKSCPYSGSLLPHLQPFLHLPSPPPIWCPSWKTSAIVTLPHLKDLSHFFSDMSSLQYLTLFEHSRHLKILSSSGFCDCHSNWFSLYLSATPLGSSTGFFSLSMLNEYDSLGVLA